MIDITVIYRTRRRANLDMMIAAHALAAQAELVTHNRIFRRVKRLKIEDWAKAY